MRSILLFLSIFLCFFGNAQEKGNSIPVTDAFYSTRVIMSHSVQMLRPGGLDFRILHRFGPVNGGINQLFGLDGPASVRLGLDYGLSRNLTIGIGRSSYRKELDGFLKYRLLQQATGDRPVALSLAAVGGITVITGKGGAPAAKYSFANRTGYYAQLIAGRKFTDRFSLQLVPSFVHQNLLTFASDANDIFAIGSGAQLRVSRRIALTADYHYVFNPNSADFHNPLSIGIDIGAGSHVFQLHFTNAAGMNERAFLTETFNDWGKGDAQLGFNISRIFNLGRKSK